MGCETSKPEPANGSASGNVPGNSKPLKHPAESAPPAATAGGTPGSPAFARTFTATAGSFTRKVDTAELSMFCPTPLMLEDDEHSDQFANHIGQASPPPRSPPSSPAAPVAATATAPSPPLAATQSMRARAHRKPLGYVDDRKNFRKGRLLFMVDDATIAKEHERASLARLSASLSQHPVLYAPTTHLITRPISGSPKGKIFKEVLPLVHAADVRKGSIGLDHFPSQKAVKQHKAQGCTLVITLQKDEEGAQVVRKLCKKNNLEWLQVDFWRHFHRKEADVLWTKVAYVASVVQDGGSVLVHCAAGIHRTGMFAYAVLMALGYTPKAALESLRIMRETCWRRVGLHRIQGVHEMLKENFPDPSLEVDAAWVPDTQEEERNRKKKR
eukprot:Rhum_TRINITY_DN13366_c0_g1::Rhum_TRINITY_DN13366_c0_g1_i1::g.59481::m.59481